MSKPGDSSYFPFINSTFDDDLDEKGSSSPPFEGRDSAHELSTLRTHPTLNGGLAAHPLHEILAEEDEEFNNSSRNNIDSEKFSLSPPSSVTMPLFKGTRIQETTENRNKNELNVEISPKERAVEYWKKIENIDEFLISLQEYHSEGGIVLITLNRILHLSILAFVVVFTLVLLNCVDYSFISKAHEPGTHDRIFDYVHLEYLFSLPFYYSVCALFFCIYWVWQLYKFAMDIPRLSSLEEFCFELLHLTSNQLQTVKFSEVLLRLLEVQRIFPHSQLKLESSHDLAMRVMRRENYMIAMINKDIMNISLPFLPGWIGGGTLTKTLERNVEYCILAYLFDARGNVKQRFLNDSQRSSLTRELRKRLVIVGLFNFILSPFIFFFVVIYYLLKYGQEFYQNPHLLGARAYTQYSRWKFREFNELSDFFDSRIKLSYKKARKYMNSFHSKLIISIAQFSAFISGSFMGTLIVLSVINEDLLIHLDVTPGHALIWYLGIFGIIVAISRSFIPNEDSVSSDPCKLMSDVITHTHYMPKHWKNNLDSPIVQKEFGKLFQYRLLSLVQELFSIFTTPLILCFSLPNSASSIVDFVREFTLHVDGIGYVCSFSVFDFKRHGNPKYGSYISPNDKYQRTKGGKLEKSLISFKLNNPDWNPTESASLVLSRLKEAETKVKNSILAASRHQQQQHGGLNSTMMLSPNTTAKRTPQLQSIMSPPNAAEESVLLSSENDDEIVNPGMMSILNQFYDKDLFKF